MSSNFDTYQIYYKPTAGGTYTYYDTSSTLTPTIGSLAPNTAYYVRLIPFSSISNLSGSSIDTSATTLGQITAQSISSIDASNQLTIKWTGTYSTVKIEYSSDYGQNYTQYGTTFSTSPVAIKGLPQPNTQYYFKITPYNTLSVGGTAKYITDASSITLGHVSALSASTVDISGITVSWSGSYNSVAIFYGNTKTNTSYSTTISSAVTPNTKIFTDLSSGTLYYFNVYPYNSYGLIGAKSTVLTSTDDGYLDPRNMMFAASVRLLVTSYSGPVVTVRRSSDNATADFYTNRTQTYFTTGAGGTGQSYADWIGASTGYVTKWYDQSGKGNHAYNSNNGITQPTITIQSGKYVVSWTTGASASTLGTILYLTNSMQPNTVFCHFYNTNTYDGTILGTSIDLSVRFGNNTGNNIYGDSNKNDWYYSSGVTKLSYVNNSAITTTFTLSTWVVFSISTASPTWSVPYSGYATNASFNTIGANNAYGEGTSNYAFRDRSITGYMTEMICHNTTMEASSMQAFYSNRVF